MHEASVCEALLDLAEEEALKRGAKRVLRVKVRVGKLSGVEPELLRFAYEALGPERPLFKRASLEIDVVDPEAQCRDCGFRWTPEEIYEPCPRCGKPFPQILGGDQLELVSIEMEVKDV